MALPKVPSSDSSFRLHQVVPVLSVRDLERAVRFYVDVLGFSGEWTWGDPPCYGGVSRDGLALHFHHLDPHEAPSSAVVSLVVENVDELYRRCGSAGVVIREAVAQRSFGMRDFVALDPDGHKLVIAEESPAPERQEPALTSGGGRDVLPATL